MNKKFNPSLRSLFEYKTLRFIGKNPEGKEWGDKGSNAPLISTKKPRIRGAADPRRMWPNGHILVEIWLEWDLAPFCLARFTVWLWF